MTKNVFLLLTASLALNAAFALVFGLGARTRLAPEPAAVLATVPAKATPPALTAEIWSGLETDDLPALITRLREAGFPNEMIRAMVTAQVAQAFAARRKALEPSADRLPFWKDRAPNPEAEIALRRLYREQAKIVRDLLGDTPDSADQVYLTQQGGRLDFLPPEKADAIRSILRDYSERRSDLYAEGGFTANREKLTALEQAQRAAIAGSLTAPELLEYDLRNSNSARDLRASLAALDPTEEEFRAIFQLRQPFDEKYNYNSGIPSPDQMRQREEAQQQLNTQIKALLAPDRAAAYDRATDYNFRQTSQLVARLELPAETTISLWDTQKEFEKRRGEIYGSVPADQRAQAFTALQQEAIAKVTPLLGSASRVEAYKQYGGAWLNNLVPRATPRKR
jgi:hypothetical protein